MNKEDIIRMARDAGIGPIYGANDESLERFADLVAAHEREECAKLAERTLCAALTGHYVDPIGVWGTQVAIDIRKKSNT